MKTQVFMLTVLLGSGGFMLAVEGKSDETTKSAVVTTEKKSKFDIPAWHSDARWKREIFAAAWQGCGIVGGPRLEAMWLDGSAGFPYCPVGGPFHLVGYDSVNEQIHDISGGSRGYLDGPLSRARFGGSGFSAGAGPSGCTPDGRFLIMGDSFNKAIRMVDLKEQTVKTVTNFAGLQSFGENGKAWLKRDGKLLGMDLATMKIVSEFELKEDCGPVWDLWVDEVHMKAYCSGEPLKKDGKTWFIWYLDLKDGGKVHGVLAGTIRGPNMSYCGSFDDYKGYPSTHIQFGPDDPEKRFLYMNVTDTTNFMRVDLEKRIVAAFSFDAKTGEGRFIDSGSPGDMGSGHAGPAWRFGSNGDFIMMSGHSAPAMLYMRVK